MRLYSWNINGVRAAVRKGLERWVAATGPDILCLQETRADPGSLPVDVRGMAGYYGYWAPVPRKGFSGVATLCRTEPSSTWIGLNVPEFNDEHRVLVTEIGDVRVYNVYFPNGKASAARLEYKLAFYEAFLKRIDADFRAGKCVVFGGDVNTAHQPIDLARPRENARRSGFLPEERAWLDQWAEHGWIDTYRHLHPTAVGAYTWWDMRTNARARNVGWRLDYWFIHRHYLHRVVDAGIAADVTGSDHCPIWLELTD